MKIPTRLALALGTLLTGVLTLTGELNLAHPVHQVIILVGGFILFLIKPDVGGESANTELDQFPPAGANEKATPAPPTTPV